MSWNQAYLDAVGVPRWVPREVEETVTDEASVKAMLEADSAVKDAPEQTAVTVEAPGVKALVNNPNAKFSIIVSEQQQKAELQKAWKQLKFAWKQWQHQDFPASLYQFDSSSSYSITQLQSNSLLLVDTSHQLEDESVISAPKLFEDKKAWWELLQQVSSKSQLL